MNADYEKYNCSKCGEDTVASYVKSVREKMVGRKLCFHCNYWQDFLNGPKPSTIIKGRVYAPGNRTSGPMRGMAGRRFDVEYIKGPHRGKRITTFDLWAGSEIPEEYRPDYPDTARFINGAEAAKAGGTSCWNPADPKSDMFPSPAKAGIK